MNINLYVIIQLEIFIINSLLVKIKIFIIITIKSIKISLYE